jgi:hypothetical protein
VSCISTHALNSVKQCINCSTLINNCTACYYNLSIAFCTTCISTYIVNTSLNQCLFCDKTCTNVPLEGCTTVDASNTLGLCNQTNCSCLTCATPYWMDPNRQCILCNSTVLNCTRCVYVSTNVHCTHCSHSFYLNSTINSCIRCDTIFYGCAVCSPPNITYCQGCHWGFFMLANTSCERCSITLGPLCRRCWNSSSCRLCIQGYGFITPNVCVPCNSSIHLTNCL